jgi:phage terminase large subunit-like protein
MDPATRKSEARRFYLNQLVGIGDEEGWLPPGAWDACAAKRRRIEDGASVVLGFDGSLNRDSTALVVVSCEERPHVDVAGLWERPSGSAGADWRVPKSEVLDAIREACARWKVQEIACDTSRWVAELEDLAEEGLPVVAYPQSRARMVPATERATAAVMEHTLTHSADRSLSRHVANAIRRPDGQLSKVSLHSPRKIDLAVAFVMALDRASQIDASPGGGVHDLDLVAEQMYAEGRGIRPSWISLPPEQVFPRQPGNAFGFDANEISLNYNPGPNET